MKLTAYDKPIGAAKCAPLPLPDDTDDRPPTLAEIARDHGVHRNAVTNFKRRHPECRHWSVEQICQQMAANKDQSAVARRQQIAGRRGFVGISYA